MNAIHADDLIIAMWLYSLSQNYAYILDIYHRNNIKLWIAAVQSEYNVTDKMFCTLVGIMYSNKFCYEKCVMGACPTNNYVKLTTICCGSIYHIKCIKIWRDKNHSNYYDKFECL